MKPIFSLILMSFFAFTVSAGKIDASEKQKILSVLDKQIEAWNEGNLEKFMETYWKSEKLVFVGSRGPTYGWHATLDNYKKGYPDKAAMGILEFKILEVSKIDTKTAFVIGRFELSREMGDMAGHFTLVMQLIHGKWLIVSDHSSSE